MVWVKNVGMKPVYVCDACGFGYEEPKSAVECEEYCKKHNACSLKITKKAIYRPEQ
jgi:hypothetical protein